MVNKEEMDMPYFQWVKKYPKKAAKSLGKGLLIGFVAATIGTLAVIGAIALATANKDTINETDPEKYLERSISEIRAQLSDAEFELAELRNNS